MNRPFVSVALCYASGVILGWFMVAPLAGCLAAALAFVLNALLFSRCRALLLAPALFLFGWLNMTSRTEVIAPHDLRNLLPAAEIVSMQGEIASTPVQRVFLRKGIESTHTLAELQVTGLRLRHGSWQPAHGRVMTSTADILPQLFVQGQQVEVSGAVLQPEAPIAKGLFDYRRHLNTRGIYYELKVKTPEDWKLAGPVRTTPLSDRFRRWAQVTLARGLPETDESLRLQWAMLLGWQTALTNEVSAPFMRSGTMHIFAVSGLHIALIAGIFVALLRAINLPRSLCGLLVIPLIWFYTAATGWQASAIRSSVMMTVILLGWSLSRPTDLLNSLAVAGSIILVWQPEQLFQASFQLSFFVVLSIALLAPSIEALKQKVFTLDPLVPAEVRPHWQRMTFRLGNAVWICFATSLAAFIGSIPLIAFYFHLFTPVSLLANLVIVPISSLALMSGLGALITGDWVPLLTECFNHSGWFFMHVMIRLSETAADLPHAWCYTRAPGLLLFVLYYGLLIALCAGWLARPKLRRWVLGSALGLAGWWALECRQERAWHRLTILPLNGGHAVFTQPAQGAREWLFDSGDQAAVEFVLQPFLQAQGINRLPNMLLTVGEARQTAGVTNLHKDFPLQQVHASPIHFRSGPYHAALSELAKSARVLEDATNGGTLGPWTILHPASNDHFPVAGDNGVVAWSSINGVRLLLAADLGRPGQNAIFQRHPELRADIIVAGLPDRDDPLATEWLEVIHPKLIVLADSEFPANRRASSKLAARLRRTGAEVIFTREAGAVTVAWREGRWQTERAR